MSLLKPLKIYTNLSEFHKGNNSTDTMRKELYKKGGVYSFIFKDTDGRTMQYIGSSKNLDERMQSHLKGRDSNARLQRSIKKYGIDKFTFVIYYWHNDPLVRLTDIETEVIKSFPFETLYNLKKEAVGNLGYKHTTEAIAKMKLWFQNKTNHPMYGKNHSIEAKLRISKPGSLNPIFGKLHTEESKQKISLRLSKSPIGLYNLDGDLIKQYANQVELAREYNLNKTTISRYLISSRVFQGKYVIRKIT